MVPSFEPPSRCGFEASLSKGTLATVDQTTVLRNLSDKNAGDFIATTRGAKCCSRDGAYALLEAFIALVEPVAVILGEVNLRHD